MATRRAIIGRYANGQMGLKTSLPGFDARDDDDNDPTKFSFNSAWTDIVYIDQYGIADPPVSPPTGAGWTGPVPGALGDPSDSIWLKSVSHGLGYVPYVEARAVSPGNLIWDDYRTFQNGGRGQFNGEKAWAFSSVAKINTWAYTDWTGSVTHTGHRVAYIIYRLPVNA